MSSSKGKPGVVPLSIMALWFESPYPHRHLWFIRIEQRFAKSHVGRSSPAWCTILVILLPYLESDYLKNASVITSKQLLLSCPVADENVVH